jgi:hypothetical protein
MIVREILKGCEVNLETEGGNLGLDEIKTRGQQILKDFLENINENNNEAIINEIGRLIGLMSKVMTKTGLDAFKEFMMNA